MKQNWNILKHSPLFAQLSEEETELVLHCLGASKKSYSKNELVFSVGQEIVEAGIVLSGSVCIEKIDYWGNRAILAKMTSGDLFGEAFSCAETKHSPINAVAAEKSEILWIHYQKIANTCSSACTFHSRLIQNMLKILANKNIMLTNKMEHLVKRTTREKLLSYLSSQSIKANNNSFSLPFNRQELADYLSVDRSAMSNELCKLRDEGILEFHKNFFNLKQDAN